MSCVTVEVQRAQSRKMSAWDHVKRAPADDFPPCRAGEPMPDSQLEVLSVAFSLSRNRLQAQFPRATFKFRPWLGKPRPVPRPGTSRRVPANGGTRQAGKTYCRACRIMNSFRFRSTSCRCAGLAAHAFSGATGTESVFAWRLYRCTRLLWVPDPEEEDDAPAAETGDPELSKGGGGYPTKKKPPR